MRIRKNRKILAEEGCSSTPISFTVCQLNRAPWDDDSCFSQFLQEQWDDCLPVNGSLVDYIHASERDLRELSLEFIEKTGFTTKLVDDQVEPKTTSFCKKRRSTVAEPKKLTPATPPPPSIPAEPRKRGRPKKTKPTLPAPATGSEANNDNNYNTNPYSYYYYSGFGPSWGKRRGGNNKHCKNENSYMNKNGGNCNWGMDNDVSNTPPGSDSSMSQTEDDNGGQDEDEKKYAKKTCDIVIVDEVLDYIDDDFDDDDEDEDGFGQKRPRKPIKARSLKSLM